MTTFPPLANPGDATPRYLRLAHTLAVDIRRGVYAAHAALPAERVLAQAHQVSRVTARNAIAVLVEQGLVVNRHGSGNFIAPRLSQSPSNLASFSNELRQRGLVPSNRWIAQQVAPATAADGQALGLAPGTPVACLERVRLANDQPLAYERSVLPCTVLPEPSAVGESLYQYLARQGHFPAQARQSIRACNATASMARHLGIAPRTAVLWIERTSFDDQDRAIEFTQSYCRSDAYDFSTELKACP